MELNRASQEENNGKILSILMLIILFVSMGQSVYWQTMPIIGREFNFTEVEINTVVSISAAMFIVFTPFWGKLLIGARLISRQLRWVPPISHNGFGHGAPPRARIR